MHDLCLFLCIKFESCIVFLILNTEWGSSTVMQVVRYLDISPLVTGESLTVRLIFYLLMTLEN